MKKLFLIGAILMGGIAASQAGVHLNFGFSLPLPGVVVTHPAPCYTPPPPVYYAPAPAYCYPAPRTYYYSAPPAYCPPPAVVVTPPTLYFGFGHYHHDWDRRWHHRW